MTSLEELKAENQKLREENELLTSAVCQLSFILQKRDPEFLKTVFDNNELRQKLKNVNVNAEMLAELLGINLSQ